MDDIESHDKDYVETSTEFNSMDYSFRSMNRNTELEFVDVKKNDEGITIEKESDVQTENYIFANVNKNFYQRIGNLYCFWFDDKCYPRIAIGPHWPMYVCFTSILAVTSYFLLFVILADNDRVMKIIGYVIYLLQFLFYTTTFLANPGLPDQSIFLENYKGEVRGKICEKCGIVIPPGNRITHCDDCNVCIIGIIFKIGYDHHCPWTSKCIGKGNLTSFHGFVAFTMIFFGYLILAVSTMNK